jgi:hypothetical protein
MEQQLVRLCRQILFHETDILLRVGIRNTMKHIYKKGLDDPKLKRRLHKNVALIKSPKLRAKMQRLLNSMETTETDSPESEPKFQVERIIGLRIKSDHSRMYLVHWKGYESDDDSWEPAHQLIEDKCGDMIARFHREHMQCF